MKNLAVSKSICLVGCGKQKFSRATFAKDMYTSDYFGQLLPLIQEFKVKKPLEGMRQAEQNRWLKEQLKVRDHGHK